MDRRPRGETELVAKSADDVRPISWAVLSPQCHLAMPMSFPSLDIAMRGSSSMKEPCGACCRLALIARRKSPKTRLKGAIEPTKRTLRLR